MIPFYNGKYPGEGRQLCDPVLGSNCRYEYGRIVVSYCGTHCVYCDCDVAEDYRAWLSLSVDHVVPQHKLAVDYNAEWIRDLSNQVTCCRACNEFLNRLSVDDPAPQNLQEFYNLRDRVFIKKRELAATRHAQEQQWHQGWRAGLYPHRGRHHTGR